MVILAALGVAAALLLATAAIRRPLARRVEVHVERRRRR